jgi:hypothetical protein
MGFAERITLIKKIEELRGSTVLCFLTSLRQNVPAQISEDAVRVFFDHASVAFSASCQARLVPVQ